MTPQVHVISKSKTSRVEKESETQELGKLILEQFEILNRKLDQRDKPWGYRGPPRPRFPRIPRTCFKCNEMGHFVNNCPKNQPSDQNQTQDTDSKSQAQGN